MSIYRLDYTAPDAAPTYRVPVSDILGVRLLRTALLAREEAIDRATSGGVPVAITRISGAGGMRHTFTAHPDGRVTRPRREQHR